MNVEEIPDLEPRKILFFYQETNKVFADVKKQLVQLLAKSAPIPNNIDDESLHNMVKEKEFFGEDKITCRNFEIEYFFRQQVITEILLRVQQMENDENIMNLCEIKAKKEGIKFEYIEDPIERYSFMIQAIEHSAKNN